MMSGSDARTLVLIGKTGNGKSATGNSILGNKLFQSKHSFCRVTSSCELKTSVLEDGQMLNVIDTPGFFDSSGGNGTIGDIVNCMKLAIDGIHAVLVVFSVCNWFFEEEKAAISSLQDLFGKRICDYMIVVFTGGDELEEDGKTLEDFLYDCSPPLKEILSLCGNRFVLFDNKTNDETKKANQVHELLSLVKIVVEKKGGEPYTNEIFTEMKKWSKELQEPTEWTNRSSEHEKMEKMHVQHMKPKIETVEMMMMGTKLKLEQEMLARRLMFEKIAKTVRKNAEERAESMRKELKKRIASYHISSKW